VDSLFNNFDNIIVFDFETTGFDPKKEEIIEIAALRVVNKKGVPVIEDGFDVLVKLTPNKHLPVIITNLTGITEKMLVEKGVSKDEALIKLSDILSHSNSLLVAYNAQFDMCFLYNFLMRYQKALLLKSTMLLDVLTIYRDRRPYPHKLSDAVKAYSLNIMNSHRAGDDAKTTLDLLCKMGKETDDLDCYVNLFGYNPKYGVPRPKISSVKYLPQNYDVKKKLYEIDHS